MREKRAFFKSGPQIYIVVKLRTRRPSHGIDEALSSGRQLVYDYQIQSFCYSDKCCVRRFPRLYLGYAPESEVRTLALTDCASG